MPAPSLPRGAIGTPTYREITKPWYGTARWKRLRGQQLRNEPLCWMCLEQDDIVTPATIADHDPPHKGDEQAFWNGQLRSLCKRHHDSDKAMIEAGKPKRRFAPDGWPID